MSTLNSSFRLRSSAFERADDHEKIDPKKIIFLSVEGDETERTYFQYLGEKLDNALIRIEVLRHKRGDGYSDPQYVIELLDEYIQLRDGEVLPEEIPEAFTKKYTKEEIERYINDAPELSPRTKMNIKEDLLKIGIDVDYRRYLKTCHSDSDIFAVVIDRDTGNHSEELIRKCIQTCEEKNYGFYVTNPCFEFWLLLHLRDAKAAYTPEQLEHFLKNEKVSARHTVVSAELSRLAKHGKTIKAGQFDFYYFPHISDAIKNVKEFATTFPDLYDKLGSNLPKLFQEIGFESKL